MTNQTYIVSRFEPKKNIWHDPIEFNSKKEADIYSKGVSELYETALKVQKKSNYGNKRTSQTFYVNGNKIPEMEFIKGRNVEFEHSKNPYVAEKIAIDHFKENKNYYKFFNPKEKDKEYLIN
jgi:hypothetical protein